MKAIRRRARGFGRGIEQQLHPLRKPPVTEHGDALGQRVDLPPQAEGGRIDDAQQVVDEIGVLLQCVFERRRVRVFHQQRGQLQQREPRRRRTSTLHHLRLREVIALEQMEAERETVVGALARLDAVRDEQYRQTTERGHEAGEQVVVHADVELQHVDARQQPLDPRVERDDVIDGEAIAVRA